MRMTDCSWFITVLARVMMILNACFVAVKGGGGKMTYNTKLHR